MVEPPARHQDRARHGGVKNVSPKCLCLCLARVCPAARRRKSPAQLLPQQKAAIRQQAQVRPGLGETALGARDGWALLKILLKARDRRNGTANPQGANQ
jgi:hypothetical protein